MFAALVPGRAGPWNRPNTTDLTPTGWARVSAVANSMRQHHGQSAKDHGKASWTKVLRSLPGYEFRNEGTTSVAVRVKKSG